MSDSLDKNPFYRALINQFQDLFKLANKECSMICIPRSSSLKGVSLNKQFISSHLLKQSPLLKSHLVPLDASQIKDVEVKDKKLLVNNIKCSRIHEIEIISSEDAFNSNNKLYHINVIDRPMTFPFIENLNQSGTDDGSDESVITLNECKLYLMKISAQKFRQLMYQAHKYAKTLSITPDSLDQVSLQCASFIDEQIRIFRFDDVNTDEDIIKYSVESAVISTMTTNLMNAIRAKYIGKTQSIQQQMKGIHEKNYSLKRFGSQFDFNLESNPDLNEILSRLNATFTAIEIVSIFKDFISAVRMHLESKVQQNRSPFDVTPPIPVMTEDLVAATIIVLSAANNADIYCHLQFVQLFGNQLPSTDEMAFSVVTVEAALQVIETFDPIATTRTDRSSRHSTQTKSPVSSTSSRPHEVPKKVDPKFDRKLRSLNKLLRDVTAEDVKASSVSTSSTGSNDDDELGEFLSSLQVSKFQVFGGKLN